MPEPAGGHDSSKLYPSSNPTFTLKITFHRCVNLPASDFGKSLSSDPYLLAQINSSAVPTRHSEDPKIRYRSPTVRKNVNPEWNATWVLAGVPQDGFMLKVRIYDEDADNHDDRLGRVHIPVQALSDKWEGVKEQSYKVKTKGASWRAYGVRACFGAVDRDVDLHAQLVVSIEVLGKTKEEVGKIYTVNSFWRTHFSPMIGKLAGTKSEDDKGVERAVFQANEFQLIGPVPNELYHRFVEFKGFVAGMFEATGLRGKILHKVLQHQHERVYIYNKNTKYGELPNGPSEESTLQFLKMVHYDQGGRIFTYVITLDGLFRFTETGKEFGIDLLSKHTMHSNVNIYIAWSGEFLVRRLAHPEKSAEDPSQQTHPADDIPGGPPSSSAPKQARDYELVIDNDSGTYRPKESLLPVLQKFLEKNLPGLQIVAKNCTDNELEKIKEDQKKAREKEGDERVFAHESDGSISSSDEEDLDTHAKKGRPKNSKISAGVDLLERGPKEVIKDVFPGGETEREESTSRG